MLRSGDSSKEFSFGRAGGTNGLRLASAGDGTTAEKESIACSGAAIS